MGLGTQALALDLEGAVQREPAVESVHWCSPLGAGTSGSPEMSD
jgi:hypothetical protein